MMKRIIKTGLWLMLGTMFIVAGGAKLMGNHTQAAHFAQWGYPPWFLYFTGIVEVFGGICLFIPKARLYGIVVLSITMVGAAMTHLRAGEIGAFPIPVVLLCLLGMLAWTLKHPHGRNEKVP